VDSSADRDIEVSSGILVGQARGFVGIRGESVKAHAAVVTRHRVSPSASPMTGSSG
jgi:hypothetical protein